MPHKPCILCHHPDRDKIEHAIQGGASFYSQAQAHGLSQWIVTNHMRQHLGGAGHIHKLSSSATKAEAHLKDLERRLAATDDPTLTARLLSEKGRALDALAKLKGDAVANSLSHYVAKLGFPNPDALADHVRFTQSANLSGVREGVALAERLLRAWNAAHPDKAIEIRSPRRTRYRVPSLPQDGRSTEPVGAESEAPIEKVPGGGSAQAGASEATGEK